MASVFLVERGEYSDYSVLGVYTTQELADRACQQVNADAGNACSSYKAESREVPLDDFPDDSQQGTIPLFQVRIDKHGIVHECNQANGLDNDNWSEIMAHAEQHGVVNVYRRLYWKASEIIKAEYSLQLFVRATSAEGAAKIANERRRMLVARNLWKEV